MNYGLKEGILKFVDQSGGLNTVDPSVEIGDNQVADCLNAILESSGHYRAPGYEGLDTSAAIFAARGYGLHNYIAVDGTERLMAAAGQYLYDVNKTSGAETQRYDFGGVGEAWFSDFRDKCWVANNNAVVKVEGTTAYQVGITAPSGASAAAQAGGSLAAGDYSVYIGYARKVSSINRLFSIGQSLGTVTLSGGNGTIRITIPNSADGQVNNKVAWIKGPSETVHYYYGETNNNTSTTLDISSTANRDVTLIYEVEAANNNTPPGKAFLLVADNRLWVTSGNTAYYSLRAGTVYDLERFPDTNFITLDFGIVSMFVLGGNLYFNTLGGLYVLPNTDVNSRVWPVKGKTGTGEKIYYKYPRTVDVWNNSVIGLTGNGVRMFDGTNWVDFDISRDIKNLIDRIEIDAGAGFQPCGAVYRRDSRNEYHLCYRDSRVSNKTNNRRLALNLDTMVLVSPSQFRAAWEKWSVGAQYMATDLNNNFYHMQSIAAESTIYTENGDSNADHGVYSEKGIFLTTLTPKMMKVVSKTIIVDLQGKCRFGPMWVLSQNDKAYTVEVVIGDEISLEQVKTVDATSKGVALFGTAIFGTSTFTSESPLTRKKKLSMKLKGRAVKLIWKQTAEDGTYAMIETRLAYIYETNRFI